LGLGVCEVWKSEAWKSEAWIARHGQREAWKSEAWKSEALIARHGQSEAWKSEAWKSEAWKSGSESTWVAPCDGEQQEFKGAGVSGGVMHFWERDGQGI